MMSTVWISLFNDPKFLKELSTQGYCPERNFSEYKAKHKLRLSGTAQKYLSIDFYSRQSKKLTDKSCFVIRTGSGNFIVFDEKRFGKPYLDLDLSDAEELDYEVPKNFKHLYNAFNENLIENSSIESLWFFGIFKQIIDRISSEKEYYIGPRGNKISIFNVYLKDRKTQEILKVFTHKGQEDLDYSIFTENCIYFFEGKNFPKERSGLDIGWHKIIFPASRFKKYSDKRLIPGYFLKLGTVVYFIVFPDFKFYNGGIILNDERQFTPEHIFKIDLKRH